MIRLLRSQSLFSGMVICFHLCAFTSQAEERPNIIVFYTDDHGYADLSCQGVFDDVKTPHVDALAASGVRALHGYSTAPQCVPSRAGLLIGKFQSKFGLESNGGSLVGFDKELTIAERLQDAGYVTAQFGKWHLGVAEEIPKHGFRHVFAQNANRPFNANISLNGEDHEMKVVKPSIYHVDGCSQAAASIIDRFHEQPFFLYIAYRAPHVPLDAPAKYLKRFPGEMPERRRQALAMLSAVDDGVGLVMDRIAKHGLTDRTLVFYIGDNGAPLKIHKYDAPGSGPGWDGSLNDPLNGEKGMLTEGGMHVPFVVSYPGKVPAGQVYPHPVSALDVAATSASIAGLETHEGDFDGVNLIPYLSGEKTSPPHNALMWRWVSQSAIREGDWKLLRGGKREYLFHLKNDIEEQHNLATAHPEIADRLRQRLLAWSAALNPPGLATSVQSSVWNDYFDYYLEGKEPPPLREKFLPGSKAGETNGNDVPWIIRNGLMQKVNDFLEINPSNEGQKQTPFLARNGLKLDSPVKVRIELQSETTGPVVVSWRTQTDKEFSRENRIDLKTKGANDWQTVETSITTEERIIHVRVQFPQGKTKLRTLDLKSTNGSAIRLFQ